MKTTIHINPLWGNEVPSDSKQTDSHTEAVKRQNINVYSRLKVWVLILIFFKNMQYKNKHAHSVYVWYGQWLIRKFPETKASAWFVVCQVEPRKNLATGAVWARRCSPDYQGTNYKQTHVPVDTHIHAQMSITCNSQLGRQDILCHKKHITQRSDLKIFHPVDRSNTKKQISIFWQLRMFQNWPNFLWHCVG